MLDNDVGAPSEELESIFDEDFDDRVARFAGEGGGVVYVVKKRDEQESELDYPLGIPLRC